MALAAACNSSMGRVMRMACRRAARKAEKAATPPRHTKARMVLIKAWRAAREAAARALSMFAVVSP